MNVGIYNTTVQEKLENFEDFKQLVMEAGVKYLPDLMEELRRQFEYGGKKYAFAADREATDVICGYFGGESGVDWILGTMMKYIFRYRNLGQEKELFKIITYCYILWLKAGFHKLNQHNRDIPNETV